MRRCSQVTRAGCRWYSLKGSGKSVTGTPDVIPQTQYNPFQGGLRFPKIQAPEVSKDAVISFPVNSKMTRDPRTGSVYLRHSPEKGARLGTTRVHAASTFDEPSEAAERLLARDNEHSRRERELNAKMAVRKLMSLHFHARRQSVAEAKIEKEEELTMSARFLEERQRRKSANAEQNLADGSLPIPNAFGVVTSVGNYRTRTLKKRDSLIESRMNLHSRNSRDLGTFVATAENTASLLREQNVQIDDVDWKDRLSLGSGRSMDEILAQYNMRGEPGVALDEPTGGAEIPSHKHVPIEDEWADANDSTFDNDVGVEKEKENPRGDDRLSETSVPGSRASMSTKFKSSLNKKSPKGRRSNKK